jgi:hypothetical protein
MLNFSLDTLVSIAHVAFLDLMTLLRAWNNIVILRNNKKEKQQKIHSKEQTKKNH